MIKRCKFIVLLTFVILMGCDESIDYRQTKNINGLYYKIGANSPFSGWITNISLNIPGAATLAKCDISVKNGYQEGEVVCFSPKTDIKLYEAFYQKEKKSGAEKIYNPISGDLFSQINWSNGLKNGTEKKYYRNSKQLEYEIEWKDGKKDGRTRTYYTNGNQNYDILWENGKVKEQKQWDNKGELITDFKIINWKGTGFERKGTSTSNDDYIDTYTLRRVTSGKLDGEQLEVYKDIIITKTLYNNGELLKSQHFDFNGRLEKDATYKNGKLDTIIKEKWSDKGKLIYSESMKYLSDKKIFVNFGKLLVKNSYDKCHMEIQWNTDGVGYGFITQDHHQVKQSYQIKAETGKQLDPESSEIVWSEPITQDTYNKFETDKKVPDKVLIKISGSETDFNGPETQEQVWDNYKLISLDKMLAVGRGEIRHMPIGDAVKGRFEEVHKFIQRGCPQP